jgi:hypothetical protein
VAGPPRLRNSSRLEIGVVNGSVQVPGKIQTARYLLVALMASVTVLKGKKMLPSSKGG